MAVVLVVDDDNFALEVARRRLETVGHTVHTARDWVEVNRALRAHQIHVVLLDLNLPGLQGDRIAEFLIKRPDPPRVVVHSGVDPLELRQRARSIGAADFVSKDAGPERLCAAVQGAAAAWIQEHGRQQHDALSRPPPAEEG